MTATSTITSKNQTTLPKAVIEALGVQPSDKLLYEIEEGRVVLRARKGGLLELAKMKPFGPKPSRAFSVEEINASIAVAAAEASGRTRRKG
ncbi:hypothetical protein BH20VER1_BH20VER1_21930 [soil metagenome]